MGNYYKLLVIILVTVISGACHKSTQEVFQQTEAIKKYGLVFRLPDDKRRIEYFEKQGLAERAKAEKLTIAQNNRELVTQFQKEFDFCPIHFYYASQSDELLAGKRVLLNSEMVPDASIPLPEQVILANFAPGKVEDNSFQWRAFQIEGTSIRIRPTYKTWWSERQMDPKDVRRINKILHKMNTPK